MADKIAISASRALGALHARMGQGVRMAPQVLEQAGQAAGAASTPANLRRLVLGAGDDAKAIQRTQQFTSHPIPAARRAAAEQVTALEQSHPERMYDLSRPSSDILEGIPWASQEKKQMLFGQSTLHDPQNLLKPPAGPSPIAATQIAPTVAGKRAPVAAATVAGRRRKLGYECTFETYAQSTNYPGRTQNLQQDPKDQIRTLFSENQEQLDDTADSAQLRKTAAAYKLHGRISFRGLPISIENRKGSYRHWHDPHTGKDGKTKMLYAYGYIRRTKGLDGDHVDVFVGPNEKAKNVYVVMTNKAPDFKERDEEKCMLGFDTEEAAVAAFKAHYDKDGFFHSVKAIPFETFEKRVFATFDGTRRKVAYEYGHAGPIENLTDPLGVHAHGLGYPPVGAQRHILAEPLAPTDRVDRMFRTADMDQDTTAIESTGAAPSGEPVL